MADLKEIQKVELEILCFFDSICRKNNVQYAIGYGTFLGAVRHKGFIPWDDDVDIYMNINDFNSIKKYLSNDDYFLQTPESDIEMPFIMYKIRKNNSVMPEPGKESLNMHQGIWIDIFVYIDSAKTKIGKKLQFRNWQFLQTYRRRFLKRNLNEARKLHIFFTKIPKKFQLLVDRFFLFNIKFLSCKSSSEFFVLEIERFYFYPKAFFDELDDYDFENYRFLGPKNYNDYLTMLYGSDYMTPKKWSHLGEYSNVVINTQDRK